MGSLFTRIKIFIHPKHALPQQERWDIRYAELLIYKQKTGDCDVPYNWSENLQLARWMNTQRQLYRKHWLSRERIEKLNTIGFNWKARHKCKLQ